MFNKNKTSWNGTDTKSDFKRDIADKIEVNNSIDSTMNRNLKTIGISLNEAVRNIGTLYYSEFSFGRFAYAATLIHDGIKLVSISDDVKNYSSEIVNISKENNVDYRIVANEVTYRKFQKGLSDMLFRDILPAVGNSIIKEKVKLDTPLKKSIVDLNLVGLLGLGVSEGLDELVSSINLKKAEKEGNKDRVVGILYYKGEFKDTKFAFDKVIEREGKVLCSVIQGTGTGITRFISARSKMNKPQKDTTTSDTISILVYSTCDGDSDKKTSPSTDTSSKTTKKVVSKVDSKTTKK